VATGTATAPNDAEEILRRMAQIRRELHQDVREVVASAEAVTDWHRYIRMYPWAAVGVAFAVGFVIVPRRHKSVPRDLATQADVARVREVVEDVKDKAKDKKVRRGGILGALVAFAGPIAMRAAQGYAVQYLEHWIAQQQQLQQMMGASLGMGQPQAPGGPGRPGPGGRAGL